MCGRLHQRIRASRVKRASASQSTKRSTRAREEAHRFGQPFQRQAGRWGLGHARGIRAGVGPLKGQVDREREACHATCGELREDRDRRIDHDRRSAAGEEAREARPTRREGGASVMMELPDSSLIGAPGARARRDATLAATASLTAAAALAKAAAARARRFVSRQPASGGMYFDS